MTTAYIALGANLSNRKAAFIKALKKLESHGVSVRAVSGLWQSPSWPPGQGHPDYLNAVAEVEFFGAPESLLDILHTVEADFGRVRSERNAPRPMDLDILDFGGMRLDSERLILPHPRMLSRGFVLFPLSQVAPDWRDPMSANHLEHFIARIPLSEVQKMSYQGQFWPNATIEALESHKDCLTKC
ncbi:MAG: 2-amino-4-hydroxy-6-hydroxymethyldihydropteridine diphosphokinase [Alphaproteobacteria bacterium]